MAIKVIGVLELGLDVVGNNHGASRGAMVFRADGFLQQLPVDADLPSSI